MNDNTKALIEKLDAIGDRIDAIDGMYSWSDDIAAIREALVAAGVN